MASMTEHELLEYLKSKTNNLSDVLFELHSFARSRGHTELTEWCELEQRGYSATDPVPRYRNLAGFAHINGIPPSARSLPLQHPVRELHTFLLPSGDRGRFTAQGIAGFFDFDSRAGKAIFAGIREEARRRFLKEYPSPQPQVSMPSSTTEFPPDAFDISFVTDHAIRVVVERNITELHAALNHGLYTAAIVLAGAIGEGVLYDALVQRKTKAMDATRVPTKGRPGTPKDIEKDDWNFFNYIEVAEEIKVIEPTTARSAHQILRDFRNMSHPKFQSTKGLTPDEVEMKASVWWVVGLLRDVRRAP